MLKQKLDVEPRIKKLYAQLSIIESAVLKKLIYELTKKLCWVLLGQCLVAITRMVLCDVCIASILLSLHGRLSCVQLSMG